MREFKHTSESSKILRAVLDARILVEFKLGGWRQKLHLTKKKNIYRRKTQKRTFISSPSVNRYPLTVFSLSTKDMLLIFEDTELSFLVLSGERVDSIVNLRVFVKIYKEKIKTYDATTK